MGLRTQPFTPVKPVRESSRPMARVKALRELVLTDWRNAVHRFGLVVIVGVCRLGERVSFPRGELVVVEFLALDGGILAIYGIRSRK